MTSQGLSFSTVRSRVILILAVGKKKKHLWAAAMAMRATHQHLNKISLWHVAIYKSATLIQKDLEKIKLKSTTVNLGKSNYSQNVSVLKFGGM